MLGRHAAKDLQSLGYLILIACCGVLSPPFLFFPLEQVPGRHEYDLYTVQKIFIAMYCTLPAALPLPPSPIAVALACRPCAHIITLAPSSCRHRRRRRGCT
ncbi:hypothetical protein EDB86DRAFT_2890539 [Lactarius hatsudake]|nr:hypothetical protein EDB86DRAFT_2969627 [Lactarius hatsudake]KAH9003864.1 hypothetical protein EDB86DRAFT_2890539 [Lactarius hatsudake]